MSSTKSCIHTGINYLWRKFHHVNMPLIVIHFCNHILVVVRYFLLSLPINHCGTTEGSIYVIGGTVCCCIWVSRMKAIVLMIRLSRNVSSCCQARFFFDILTIFYTRKCALFCLLSFASSKL